MAKEEKKVVNLYLLRNDYTSDGKPRKGGQFFNLYISEGSLGDISELVALTDDTHELEKQLKDIDPTFKKSGGMILKLNVQIGNISMFGKGLNYSLVSPEESAKKARSIEKLKLMNERNLLIAEIKRTTERLDELHKEEQLEELKKVIKLPSTQHFL